MSYYSREWDQGKEWGAGMSKMNGREREGEDGYSGDWKRRKYNNGVRIEGRRLLNIELTVE